MIPKNPVHLVNPVKKISNLVAFIKLIGDDEILLAALFLRLNLCQEF
jgi:hypothetical protein